MNPEDYVSYPLALALKKHGFDLEVNHVYDKNGKLWEEGMYENADCDCTAYFDYNKSGYIEVGASAPTLAQAQKWLREEKYIHVEPAYAFESKFILYIKSSKLGFFKILNQQFGTYEQALSAGIAAALELIENNKNN